MKLKSLAGVLLMPLALSACAVGDPLQVQQRGAVANLEEGHYSEQELLQETRAVCYRYVRDLPPCFALKVKVGDAHGALAFTELVLTDSGNTVRGVLLDTVLLKMPREEAERVIYHELTHASIALSTHTWTRYQEVSQRAQELYPGTHGRLSEEAAMEVLTDCESLERGHFTIREPYPYYLTTSSRLASEGPSMCQNWLEAFKR